MTTIMHFDPYLHTVIAPDREDVRRELRKVRDRHPRGTDQVLDILAQQAGCAHVDHIERNFGNVYNAARACRCGFSPPSGVEVDDWLARFFEHLVRVEKIVDRDGIQYMRGESLSARYNNLVSIEDAYNAAKDKGEEHAYPLVGRFNAVESAYHFRAQELIDLVEDGRLRSVPLPSPTTGRQKQLSDSLRALDCVQGVVDFAAEHPDQLDAAQRIGVRFIERFYLDLYKLLANRWAGLAREFKKHEREHA